MVVNRIIRASADERRLSAHDIARMTGYPDNRIFEIMSNNSSVTPSEAFTICDALGVNLKMLLESY